ncbi:DUF4233 domain-containing protein [Nakamurella sp. PAMC28650]|jgi:hypothetical protein|uniref:DUF4233 domain-containing protein n=1 Tax=Nakamurella sp. PAMC28650 TaxID=2762325 RepID=UPI00164E54EA|nr:DUF4233 domain-containing protein [Nakamurella sp. PAMC28650]QNK80688.1 DUF4233 domain-containing protein [Nakamurella sp. PAMC28650]
MTEPIEPGAEQSTGPAPAPTTRPYDPERGLRGVMSATLILEALVVLLAIPVARNTGSGTSALGVILICLLAVALILACKYVTRPWFVPAALGLQGLMIIGWLITPSLGVMGIVFGLVWALVIWFRNEFRRRLAAGTLPAPTPPA